MKVRVLRVIGLLVGAAVLASVALAASGNPQPRDLVLSKADVPPSLDVAVAFTVTNQRIAHDYGLTMRQLTAWGRLTGYRIEFGRTRPPRLTDSGPLAIKSTASICATAAGAHAYYLNGKQAIPVANRFKRPPKIGDETLMASERTHDEGVPLILYSIGWRQGRILGGLLVSGIPGRLTPAEVIALARTQQRKILSKGS